MIGTYDPNVPKPIQIDPGLSIIIAGLAIAVGLYLGRDKGDVIVETGPGDIYED